MSVPFPSPAAPRTTLSLRPEELRPHPLCDTQPPKNLIIRLANSIKKYGILEPISVRPAADPQGFPYYEIIDGHRRYQAAQLAELRLIPCRVLQPTDAQCAKMELIAALKGQNSHFFEQAESFHRLMTSYRMTQEEIARYMHLSQSAVANKLRLLQLEEPLRRRIQQAALTERHARSLLRVPNEDREQVLTLIIEKKANVALADRLIEAYLSASSSASQPEAKPAPKPPVPEAPISEQLVPEPLVSAVPSPAPTMRPIQPSKFALRDLRPLYNSIERSLAIFRKTGASADCRRHEDESGTYIVIHIPKQGSV